MDYNKLSKEELIGYLKNLDEKFQSLETYLKNEIQELVTQNHILKEESFKISRLINNITDTIWELDDKLNFIFVNFASKNLTGYLPEELTGKSLFNFLHEDDIVPLKEKYEERLKKFSETRQITEHIFDFRLKNKKGHYNWVEVLSNPIVDENGRLKGFRGVCRDISQWKEANEKLILSEQKLFKIFNSIPLAIIVFRINDKKLIDLNKAAEEFTGYTRDELIAENPLVYNIWDNPEDRNKYLESIKNSQKLDQLKIGFRTRTGNIGTALISTDFIVFENEPCSIVYFEVITEKIKTERMLEESREKYKELGEAVFDSIFILEGNKFVEQNSLAKKVFGYSFEEIESKEFTELFVSDKREMIRQCMKSGFSNPLHVNALKKNGSVFPALIRARLMQYFDKSVWAVSVSDLSQQRIIEEKLIESEKQFRLIFEKTNDAIFWAEASSGILIRCNKAAEQLVERTEQELIGQHHSILHPNEKLDDSSKQFREHVQNKGIQALESIVITKSGILKTVEVTSTIINIDGKIINQGVFKDITQKMKLAEALKSLVMPWTKSDLPGVFAFIVQNLLRVVQVKYGFIGQITGEKHKKIETITFCRETTFLDNFSYDLEYTPCAKVIEEGRYICKKNASEIFAHDVGLKKLGVESYYGYRLEDSNGNPMGVMVVMDDKEMKHPEEHEHILSLFAYKAANELERKQAEDALMDSWANLLAIVENTDDNIWAIDKNYKLIFINQKFEREFNQAYGIHLLPGMNIIENLPVPLVETWKGYYNRALANERFAFEEHFEYENLNVYTEISMNPIVAQGKIIGVSVFARDITARKLAEIMLKEKNKEIEARNAEYLHLNEKLLKATEDLILAKNKAEESDRMKTSFLQNMSHEIRTPMNAIMGFSSLLTSQYNNRHKLEQYSDIINNRCKDLLEIINDILDIAKIESGQFAVNEEECNLHQLNAELLTFFGEHQKRAGKGHIHFTLKSFEDDSETIVMADKGKLKQIFINLIGNAFKFTDKGKIEGGYIIEDKYIKFYISDTGIGIPDDKKDYIFERFAQINQSGNRLYGGTGLGLAIVKGLVNLLGGKVSVDSELGKGSTFYFTIPYKPIHHEKKHMNASEKDEELRFNGIKILIVEDDRYNAQYLHEILKEANFIVYSTAFGKEALPIITENKIPIVLMDIRLPDINGYQVTNTIKEVLPDTIIIAQTAYAAPEDKTRALESGCNDYISKPIKKELLLNMIKKHLNI